MEEVVRGGGAFSCCLVLQSVTLTVHTEPAGKRREAGANQITHAPPTHTPSQRKYPEKQLT